MASAAFGSERVGRVVDADRCWLHIRPVNVAELKKRLSGGFRPFAIRTTDGQEFAIPHPEFILIGKYSVAVLDKQGYINHLDPLHIVCTKELSRRNGSS